MGKEQKMVVWSFAFVFLTFAVMGIFMEQTVEVTKYGRESSFSSDVPVQYTPIGEYSSNGRIKAMLKGSIYETGSNMTVFGACFDGDGYPLKEATATFTAWYPNGSIVTGPNATMDKIYDDFYGYDANGTGRWKIHVTMSDTIGTYLTEIRCEYNGDYAVAFGEWQNPEWVQRIGETQSSVNETLSLLQNVSSDLTVFKNDTANNFSTVIGLISSFNSSITLTGTDQTTKLKEMYNAILALPTMFWVLDEENPTYSLASGVNNFRAVDMVDENNVCVAGEDGSYQCWDGNVWTYGNWSSYRWFGLGMVQSSAPYFWMVGDDTVEGYYSVNGGTPQTVSGNTDFFKDVALVRDPNDPSANMIVIIVGTDHVYSSNDYGGSWSSEDLTGASLTRISEIVWNAGTYPDNDPGYRYMVVGDAGQAYFFNGTSLNLVEDTSSYSFTDVSLLYDDLGYVVGYDAATETNVVWKFSGENLSFEKVYEWSNASTEVSVGKGIAAVSEDDVWVVTTDPSVFYHYDGFAWEYVSFPYSRYLSITIGFGNFSIVTGLHDIVMSDEFHGYAVGDDGLVLEFMNEADAQYEVLLENLTTNVNLTTQVLDYLTVMNTSIFNEFTTVENYLSAMNASIEYKLDNIINNVTYTQLYLETTINPLLGDILVQLGIIEGKLNTTIELQNTTLQIVNETASDVDLLVNRSNRIRAWITQ